MSSFACHTAPVTPVWAFAWFCGSPDERQACAGEYEDFERRMAAAWPGISRLVERLMAWPGRPGEAEDVVQEVFFAAWRQRRAFRGDAEWTTWLHSIAVRRARNAVRARERRERWFGITGHEATIAACASAGADGAKGAESQLSATVRQRLARLRHADREILVLRYLEELGTDEIRARLRISRAAVDARLSRARKRLGDLLDEVGGVA